MKQDIVWHIFIFVQIFVRMVNQYQMTAWWYVLNVQVNINASEMRTTRYIAVQLILILALVIKKLYWSILTWRIHLFHNVQKTGGIKKNNAISLKTENVGALQGMVMKYQIPGWLVLTTLQNVITKSLINIMVSNV